ncbi:MAG: helix-turn-helix domain-containing protein, partial [Fusobacterium sp.]
MTLGERIKKYRKKMNYTLKELSDITKLSVGFLSNIERDLN